ncbi:MAG: hypothetical protein QME51_10305 [Planctomycetota bacterium]|nr:hypothetical protein [Planctomycetota bacterium]
MTKCKAIIRFGDDYGDNSATFHCQLEKGHKGKHSEIGRMKNFNHGKYNPPEILPYILEWDGDDRETCDICGKKNENLRICFNCDALVCPDDRKEELCLQCFSEKQNKPKEWMYESKT